MERISSNRRRYLTQDELEKLIKAGRKGRYGRRDATLILLMARHGLRVTEAIDLRWGQIDFSKGHLHVRRLKGGIHSVHPFQGDELRALRGLRREQQPESAFVFITERGGPMTRSNVAKIIEAAGDRAGLTHLHPHMLRHTCGGRCRARHPTAATLARPLRHKAHCSLFGIKRSAIPRLLALRFWRLCRTTTQRWPVDSFCAPCNGWRPGRLQTHRRAC
jgi:integrase